MYPSQIKAKKTRLLASIRRAETTLDYLQSICTHPEKERVSYPMGYSLTWGWYTESWCQCCSKTFIEYHPLGEN